MRVLACLAPLLLAGCLKTLYEPAICTDERWDTTTTIVEGQGYYVRPDCEIWRALSDSTKCWASDGRRVACSS